MKRILLATTFLTLASSAMAQQEIINCRYDEGPYAWMNPCVPQVIEGGRTVNTAPAAFPGAGGPVRGVNPNPPAGPGAPPAANPPRGGTGSNPPAGPSAALLEALATPTTTTASPATTMTTTASPATTPVRMRRRHPDPDHWRRRRWRRQRPRSTAAAAEASTPAAMPAVVRSGPVVEAAVVALTPAVAEAGPARRRRWRQSRTMAAGGNGGGPDALGNPGNDKDVGHAGEKPGQGFNAPSEGGPGTRGRSDGDKADNARGGR